MKQSGVWIGAVGLMVAAGCATSDQLVDLDPHVPPCAEPVIKGRLVSVEIRRTPISFSDQVEIGSFLRAWHDTAETATRDANLFSGTGSQDWRLVITPLAIESPGIATVTARLVAKCEVIGSNGAAPFESFVIESNGSSANFTGFIRYRNAFRAALTQNIALMLEHLRHGGVG